MPIVFVLFGVLFGWVLSRSGAGDYNVIQEMFLLSDFHMYGFLGTAMVVIAPALYLLKRRGRTLTGAELIVAPKPRHRGNVVGGLCFGVGWAMTGMCPGPILVNIGEGKLYAIAAFAGALFGAGVFGVLYERLRAMLGLPDLGLGKP